ncbi:MAG TPA: pilus assembly protein PilM [Planctomycetota bacterium]|nr:pilus assembly protein PilM [Planctomycetota bacterium]
MLTVIELGPGWLSAVTGKLNGRGPEILRAATAPLSSLEPSALKEALEKVGAAGGKAVLLVPRGQAVLRELELPEGSPDELVAMVRFQVEREVPFPLDQVRYTYVETSRANGKVRVLVVAAPRESLDPALAALQAAGTQVGGVYVSSFGLLGFGGEGGPAALVEVSAGEAEILVAEKGRMEFSRTASLPEGAYADALAEEIGRTLLAWSVRAPERKIDRIVLAGEGPDASRLAEALGSRLSQEVTPSGPGDLETAPAAGLCMGLLRGQSMPDLLHPPAASRRFRVTRAHRIGALAGLILLLLAAWAQVRLAEKRSDLEEARRELRDLEPRAAAVVRTSRQSAQAHQWYRDRAGWLPALEALRQTVDTQKLWITGATFEENGALRLQGKTASDRHVGELVGALMKTGRFAKIDPPNITPNNDKGGYRQDFVLTALQAGYEGRAKK